MSFGRESFSFGVSKDEVVITGIEGFSYEDRDFDDWRTDCYGNSYRGDGEYFEVVPPVEDFSVEMKHHLAYLVNLTELENAQINVPDFQIGLQKDDGLNPYTVIERPEGRPLTEFSDLLEVEEWSRRFDEMNQEGRRLAGNNRIIYPEERRNEDVIVETGSEELIYINPGTYVDEAFFGQFSRSDVVPSNRMQLADWLSESFWMEKL